MYVSPFPKFPKHFYETGISLKTFPYEKQNAEIKLTNYVASHLIKPQLDGYDFPLFLDRNHTILEGDTFNVFFVKNHHIYTPPTDGKILQGITRKTLATLD